MLCVCARCLRTCPCATGLRAAHLAPEEVEVAVLLVLHHQDHVGQLQHQPVQVIGVHELVGAAGKHHDGDSERRRVVLLGGETKSAIAI